MENKIIEMKSNELRDWMKKVFSRWLDEDWDTFTREDWMRLEDLLSSFTEIIQRGNSRNWGN